MQGLKSIKIFLIGFLMLGVSCADISFAGDLSDKKERDLISKLAYVRFFSEVLEKTREFPR